MEQLTKLEVNEEEVVFEAEGDSLAEVLFRGVLDGYQKAWTKNNEKFEIEYIVGITNHKITTPDGNKDVAYFKLDRAIRPKGGDNNSWEVILLHQEVYFFKNMSERLNPSAPWKEQLYTNGLARLMSAGLEYAELLRRMKNPVVEKTEEQITQERLKNLGLVGAKEPPKPLTKDEEDYKTWIKNERAKEGLT